MNNMIMFKKILTTLALAAAGAFLADAQGTPSRITAEMKQSQSYFVDGYHGGVYGHYPRQFTQVILKYLEAVPEWKVGLELEPSTWDMVAMYDPEGYVRFREMVLDGSRVEYTNPAFGQPYMYNISGESMIRQMTLGMKALQRHFPGLEVSTYVTAEPCFTSSLPTVLSSLGFKYCSTKCPDTLFGGWFSQRDAELEWWIGPDGESRILNSPRNMAATLDTYCAWSSADHSMTKAYVDACLEEGMTHPIGMTYQDAGWETGPWMDIRPEEECPFVSAPEYAEPQYILWNQYFKNVAPVEKAVAGTYSQEDMHPSLSWGAQPLQRLARMVRHAENSMEQTEKLASIARLTSGYTYPEADLQNAWESLLLSQHHDCWICLGRWVDRARTWTAGTEFYCRKTRSAALESTTDASEDAITVFNTGGTARKGRISIAADRRFNAVRDAGGQLLPSQRIADSLVFIADLPAFGWATFTLDEQPGTGHNTCKVRRKGRNVELSNDLLCITIDPSKGGSIVSAKDLRTRREIVGKASGFAFNGLSAYYPERGERHGSDETPAEVTELCSGAVCAAVSIKGHIDGVPYTQTISLTAGSPLIDCSLTVDWQGPAPLIGSPEPEDGDRYDNSGNRLTWKTPHYNAHRKMNLTFPTVGKGAICKDAPFDVCASRLETTEFSSFDDLKHVVALNWVDLETASGSLALFTDHTTSYTYGPDFPLGLTVQFVGSGYSRNRYNVDGPSTVNYALLPHAGAWDEDEVQIANEQWRQAPVAICGRPKLEAEGSLLDLSGTGWQLVTAYCEGDELYVRLYNAQGDSREHTVVPGFSFSGAQLVELDGRVREDLGSGSALKISMPRFGIRTVRFRLR